MSALDFSALIFCFSVNYISFIKFSNSLNKIVNFSLADIFKK